MTETQAGTEGKRLEGIGGWLVLVAVGLIASPIFMAVGLIQDVLPAFSGGTWARLTEAGSPNYHPLWAPLLIMEVSGTSLFILFSLVLLVLFFMKKMSVPRLVIIFLLANLAFVVIDYFLAMRIPLVASMPDESTPAQIARQAVSCVIWIPYFLRSKRVKNTFGK